MSGPLAQSSRTSTTSKSKVKRLILHIFREGKFVGRIDHGRKYFRFDEPVHRKCEPIKPSAPAIRMVEFRSVGFMGLVSLSDDVLIIADANDATSTQLHNLRAVFEGGEAVGDYEQGEVFAEAFDGLHDGMFSFVV
jgi:hypothetical protein